MFQPREIKSPADDLKSKGAAPASRRQTRCSATGGLMGRGSASLAAALFGVSALTTVAWADAPEQKLTVAQTETVVEPMVGPEMESDEKGTEYLKSLLAKLGVVEVRLDPSASFEAGEEWRESIIALDSLGQVVLRKTIRANLLSRDETLTLERTGEIIWRRQDENNEHAKFSGSDVTLGEDLANALMAEHAEKTLPARKASDGIATHKAGSDCATGAMLFGGAAATMVNTCLLAHFKRVTGDTEGFQYTSALINCGIASFAVIGTAVNTYFKCKPGPAQPEDYLLVPGTPRPSPLQIVQRTVSATGGWTAASAYHFRSLSLCFNSGPFDHSDAAECVPMIVSTKGTVQDFTGKLRENPLHSTDGLRVFPSSAVMRVGSRIPWISMTCELQFFGGKKTHYFYQNQYIQLDAWFKPVGTLHWHKCQVNTNFEGK